MIKQISLSLLIGVIATSAYAQSDSEQVSRAFNALQVTHSCDNALNYLSKVSAAGKTSPGYLYASANANDCKGNNEQAIFFYNKYLEVNPANDSVKKRVAELKDAKALAQKVANEQRIAREQYKAATHKNRNKRKNFEDSYAHLGIAFDQPVGGDNAPYNSGICISSGYGFPIINDHAIIEGIFNNDILFNANLPWYRKAFGLSSGESIQVHGGYMSELSLGLLGVIKNTHSYTWSAGITLGGKIVVLPEADAAFGTYSFYDPVSIQLTYGVRSTFFLGRNAMFVLDYSHCPLSQVSTNESSSPGSITPVNMNILRIGVSLKIPSWFQ